MDLIPLFTRRTTSGQRTVAAWTLIVVFAISGVLGFCLSIVAGTPEQAAALRGVGFWGVGLALGVYAVKRLIAWFAG